MLASLLVVAEPRLLVVLVLVLVLVLDWPRLFVVPVLREADVAELLVFVFVYRELLEVPRVFTSTP